MKHFGNTILTMVIIFSIISCNNPKKKFVESIKGLEKELYSEQSFNSEKGLKIINLYIDFSKQYPEDTASAGFLYKAAEVSMNLQLGIQAIGYYNEIIEKYPDFSKKPECVFLKAFIYENQLNDLEKAKEFYTQFIAEYPTNQLAKDAEASLKYLGKSPEELVKMFQEMNGN